jgi:hypothetical protein
MGKQQASAKYASRAQSNPSRVSISFKNPGQNFGSMGRTANCTGTSVTVPIVWKCGGCKINREDGQ